MPEKRPYTKLYAVTAVIGLTADDTPLADVPQRLYDDLVRAGWSISNAILVERTTQKHVKATFEKAA